MLYAVPLGLLGGLALGGRLEGLASVRFRWAPVAIGGFVAQLILFSGRVDGLIGGWGPVLYVASTVAVLAAVLRNVQLAGLWLVAVGAASNLAAIVANGGYMPADPGALALAGYEAGAVGFSNSIVTAAPALRPLTDVFALPAGLPMANVFSVGDVLIAAGVTLAIVAAMRRAPSLPPMQIPESTAVRTGNSPD